MCYSAAPSTTNQNATQRIYKGYEVARKSLQAYSIKMQYENVFKVIGYSCYTCLPRTAPAAAQSAQKTAYEIASSDWSSDVCSSDLLKCSI